MRDTRVMTRGKTFLPAFMLQDAAENWTKFKPWPALVKPFILGLDYLFRSPMLLSRPHCLSLLLLSNKLGARPSSRSSFAVAVLTFDVTRPSPTLTPIQNLDNTAIEQAERAGFDLSLVEASLALSPEERATQHDQALALVLEFDRIRRQRSEQPQSTTPATD